MLKLLDRKGVKLTAVALAAVLTFCACSNNNDNPENTADGNSGSGSSAAENNNTDGSGGSAASSDWSYSQLAMGGGGFVSGVFSTSEEGLYYARTDVGGAYRWDKNEEKWKSLSYNITEDDVGLLGIDGLAVDPDEPNKLYLVAGTSYFSGGKTCIMISDDYGETFETIDISDYIKVHGNGMGRQNGERIAIDPVNKNIIYIGGRTGGLIKSTDGGRTWTTLQALSDATQVNTPNGNGICSIIVDPDSSNGSECTRVYAAISKNKDDNIWVSNDGGESWAAVPDLPKGLFPQRMRLDGQGNLLIAYGATEGPHGDGSNGSIRRLNIASGEVESIQPIEYRFGDVAIDPTNPQRMVAVTENRWVQQPNGSFGDEFFVTVDGGATWESINEKMTMSDGGIPWMNGYAIHWCGCLMIDPFDPNKIKVVSGNGIFACDNIWDESPAFYFNSRGIEETVPSELVTIPGGPIVTSVYDYDGFVNDNAFEYGDVHNSKLGSITSLAVAYENTDVWVKCGAADVGFYYTLDGGNNWQKAKSMPEAGKGKGVVSVSADGKRFFWTPEGAVALYYSDDNGDTWQTSEGIYITNYVVCDPVNPDYVYATSGSAFYVSSDGGKSFETTYSLFSAVRITVVPGKEGVVYLPAAGLQVSTDHGKTFERKENLVACLGVGVGKGKDEGSPDALYVWGRPTKEDTIGIYWSEDDGETWSAVTQGDMQFGGMGNGYFIKGDVNEYGRCYISTVGLGVIVCDLNGK
ncbi:MAG: exo-alpha-sialidase [Ruminococcaceae bacterium]|nr:exo-alpha-sialidase [Oscillospiraceae bacterium]